jgi:hypothetical protein
LEVDLGRKLKLVALMLSVPGVLGFQDGTDKRYFADPDHVDVGPGGEGVGGAAGTGMGGVGAAGEGGAAGPVVQPPFAGAAKGPSPLTRAEVLDRLRALVVASGTSGLLAKDVKPVYQANFGTELDSDLGEGFKVVREMELLRGVVSVGEGAVVTFFPAPQGHGDTELLEAIAAAQARAATASRRGRGQGPEGGSRGGRGGRAGGGGGGGRGGGRGVVLSKRGGRGAGKPLLALGGACAAALRLRVCA